MCILKIKCTMPQPLPLVDAEVIIILKGKHFIHYCFMRGVVTLLLDRQLQCHIFYNILKLCVATFLLVLQHLVYDYISYDKLPLQLINTLKGSLQHPISVCYECTWITTVISDLSVKLCTNQFRLLIIIQTSNIQHHADMPYTILTQNT